MTQEDLYAAHTWLVGTCIAQYCPKHQRDKDMFQIARLALWEACIASPDKFPAYAYTCIRNALYDEMRNRHNNWPLVLPYEDKPDERDMTEGILTDLDTDAAIDKLCGDDVPMKTMVYMRLAGLTFDEIGAKFGTSGSTVQRTLKEAKKRMETE